MGKALLYIASPRRFSLFWDWINRVNFVDKLVVKNHFHHVAHKIAMKYFFAHNYDYFIVCCDDVLGSPDHVRLLLEDEEEHHFPVISGWHQVSLDKPWASLSMTPHDGIKTKTSKLEDYHFIPIKDIIFAKYGYPFIKVWYMGLPFTLIRRETLKKVPLHPFHTAKFGPKFDLQFAIDCARNKIPIMVDQRIFLLHFKPYRGTLWVGKAKPKVEFIPAETK